MENDEIVENQSPQVVDDSMGGVLPAEAVGQLMSIETSSDEFMAKFKTLLNEVGVSSSTFDAIRPTREFVLGNTNPFDEFIIQGDFESAIMLSSMHPAFRPTALTLFYFGISQLALTRSRGAIQQKLLRTYIGESRSVVEQADKKRRWSIPMRGK
ncbi:MAG: hypothetical protein ACTSW1_07325 [Candidatus Hodarchaeales archaeon]